MVGGKLTSETRFTRGAARGICSVQGLLRFLRHQACQDQAVEGGAGAGEEPAEVGGAVGAHRVDPGVARKPAELGGWLPEGLDAGGGGEAPELELDARGVGASVDVALVDEEALALRRYGRGAAPAEQTAPGGPGEGFPKLEVYPRSSSVPLVALLEEVAVARPEVAEAGMRRRGSGGGWPGRLRWARGFRSSSRKGMPQVLHAGYFSRSNAVSAEHTTASWRDREGSAC